MTELSLFGASPSPAPPAAVWLWAESYRGARVGPLIGFGSYRGREGPEVVDWRVDGAGFGVYLVLDDGSERHLRPPRRIRLVHDPSSRGEEVTTS